MIFCLNTRRGVLNLTKLRFYRRAPLHTSSRKKVVRADAGDFEVGSIFVHASRNCGIDFSVKEANHLSLGGRNGARMGGVPSPDSGPTRWLSPSLSSHSSIVEGDKPRPRPFFERDRQGTPGKRGKDLNAGGACNRDVDSDTVSCPIDEFCKWTTTGLRESLALCSVNGIQLCRLKAAASLLCPFDRELLLADAYDGESSFEWGRRQ